MASKTITVSTGVHKRLRAEKRDGETFNDVIARLLASRQPSLMKYAGAWQPMSAREEAKIRERIERIRHGTS